MDVVLCACGCGREIKIRKFHKYVGIPKYIRGHSSRCLSEEQLRKRSITWKKRTINGLNNYFIGCRKGIPKTEEQKKQMSEARKGKRLGEKHPEHSIRMKLLANKNNDFGFKNVEFHKYALSKRSPDFAKGKNNGRYIDGRKDMPGYGASIESRRRARIRNQTPPDANFNKILCFYEKAKKISIETGIQHDVDHIIPISKGGLHHEDNLQILTHTENIKKYNKILLNM